MAPPASDDLPSPSIATSSSSTTSHPISPSSTPLPRPTAPSSLEARPSASAVSPSPSPSFIPYLDSRQQPFPPHHQPLRRSSLKGKGRARGEGNSTLLAEGGAGQLWEKRATGTGPVSTGYPDCSSQDNSVLSCYPNGTTSVSQDEWSKLIWNFNYPLFIANNNTVDVYLHRANDDTLIQSWTSIPNPEGQLAFSPTELWWDKFAASSTLQDGETMDWQAYFIIKPGGSSITGDEVHQSTFVGVQTALPTSLSVSLASVSAQSTASVASLASLATASAIAAGTGTVYSSIISASRATESARSIASLSAASVLSTASASASASRKAAASGSLQGNGNGGGLPKWAIALLSVLGALLLLAALVLAYILVRRVQRRKGIPESVGSTTPMMSNNANPGSNLAAGLGGGAAGGALAGGGVAAAAGGNRRSTPSEDYDDPTSPQSPNSNNHGNIPYGHSSSNAGAGNTSLNAPSLSGQDAASISAAYRAALSEPNFDEPSPEDGNTPDDEHGGGGGPGGDEVLRRELERQGVRVQGVKGGVGKSVNDWSEGRFGRS